MLLDLNDDTYQKNVRSGAMSSFSAENRQQTTEVETTANRTSEGEHELFDIARRIADRAFKHRSLRRASSII